MLVQVLAVVGGVAMTAWLLTEVVRTVVIPRPERVLLTWAAFELARRLVTGLSRNRTPERQHRILGSFAPTVLISLPMIWAAGLTVSFGAVFWGIGVGSIGEAIELSGSSLTTLGFVSTPTFATRMVAVVEALIGLALVALMIGFLPTLYATFSRREVSVGRLTIRGGSPPTPVAFIVRLHSINRLEHVGDRWEEWEDWFVELGETHTSFPALIYFRSASLDKNWLTAAETALDTAAILAATGLVPPSGQADTMIRSGYLALRAIADLYRLPSEHLHDNPLELSVTQRQFDQVLAELVQNGIEIEVDPTQAWEDFAGWRSNYDAAVCGLQHLLTPIPTHWELLNADQ